MNKKGQDAANTRLIWLILGVLGLCLIMAFILFSSTSSKGPFNKMKCSLSAIANSKARVPLIETDNGWPLQCPTRDVQFTKEGYIEESEKEKSKVNFNVGPLLGSSLDSCKMKDGLYDCPYLDRVNEVIATRIFDCWDQFSAGNLKLFSSYETGRQCVICSIIDFSDDVKNKFGEVDASQIVPEEKSLNEYMKTNGPTARLNYYDFTQDPLDHIKGGDYYDYNFGKKYAVIFTSVNQDQLKVLGGDVMDLIQDKLLKWETDDDEEVSFVNTLSFVELDQVSQECDTLAPQ